jgi:predicted nucleic acid-binding protein
VSWFVDTSVWYAAVDGADRNHRRAVKTLESAERVVTSDHALVEAWLLTNARLGRSTAERLFKVLRETAAIEYVSPADLDRAWAIGLEFPDQDFSLVDRTSFAIMLRLGIHTAASFDTDFRVFRYGPRRRASFEVVP